MLDKLKTLPELRDVATDQQVQGLETQLVIDRDTAYRLGIPAQAIDNTLYDAFGQRQVSTDVHRVERISHGDGSRSEFQNNPDALKQYLRAVDELARRCRSAHLRIMRPLRTSLAVNHQGQFPAITLSFNLAPGAALGDAVNAVQQAAQEVGLPSTVSASFAGTAQAFQDSLSNQPYLILAALGAVYIVLGMLYESYIHPITILSTLPSAGVGALLALLIMHTGFERDRNDRRDPADWNREEKCNLNDRFCLGCSARWKIEPRKKRFIERACCVSARS